jgi:hypothetical protein
VKLSFSLVIKENPREYDILIEVMPTISNKGVLYQLTLYVEPINRTIEKVLTNFTLSRETGLSPVELLREGEPLQSTPFNVFLMIDLQ